MTFLNRSYVYLKNFLNRNIVYAHDLLELFIVMTFLNKSIIYYQETTHSTEIPKRDETVSRSTHASTAILIITIITKYVTII